MKNSKSKEIEVLQVDNLMWKVTRLLLRRKRTILSEFDLTCSQYEILGAVDYFSQNNDKAIQINLSEKTQIDPMTTSSILRSLQKRGLIERKRAIINTRTIEVKFTKQGENIYIDAKRKMNQMQEYIYEYIDCQCLIDQFLFLLAKLSDPLLKEDVRL